MSKRTEAIEVESPYQRLASINVNEHVEKKGDLSYLSWPWAVDQLMRNDPSAVWEFREPKVFYDSVMVFCTVTAFGKTIQMHLPVMDYKNKAIAKPNAVEINKAMMRCLVKAIACHGLGLYIYAGEDLPNADEIKEEKETDAEKFAKQASKKGVTPTAGALEPFSDDEQKFLNEVAEEIKTLADLDIGKAADKLYRNNLTPEEQIAVWSLLAPFSSIRSAIKKHKDTPAEMAQQA